MLLADFSQQPLIGAPQCLSASCGALALAANSRSLVVGCCCCCASLACSHRLAFSSISIINNRSLVRLNVSLPHVVLLLLLAANSRSLVVGCCCCLSGVACSLHPLIGASMSLCLTWYSCSCSQQPLIGCRLLLLPLWCCLQPQAVTSPLSLVLPKVSTIKELWQVLKVHQSSFRLQDFKLGSNYSTKR